MTRFTRTLVLAAASVGIVAAAAASSGPANAAAPPLDARTREDRTRDRRRRVLGQVAGPRRPVTCVPAPGRRRGVDRAVPPRRVLRHPLSRSRRRPPSGACRVAGVNPAAATFAACPTLELRPVTLRYEASGEGPPVLLLAPGGLRASRIDAWELAPWNPVTALADRHRVVAMDQRNTGTSFAPITASDGWPTYAADQLAVMDHLAHRALRRAGNVHRRRLHHGTAGRGTRTHRGGGGAAAGRLRRQPGRLPRHLRPVARGHRCRPPRGHRRRDGCWSNLFGSDHLLWSVPDTVLPTVDTPILVLQGDDVYHPRERTASWRRPLRTPP